MQIGSKAAEQMRRFGRVWKQGEHVLVSGPTGSGKTELARLVNDERSKRGGFVIVFVGKPNADKTIEDSYKGFERWKSFRTRAPSYMNRVLLWPDTAKLKTDKEVLSHQREVFSEAFDRLNRSGKWTVQIDEGLYTVSPTFLGLADNVAMAHAVGRSNNLTMITLTQRPSHLPLIVYGSASHAFVGRTREEADRKRLAELGAREGSKELANMIANNGRHDFTWIPVAPDWPAETVNLAR